MCGGFREQHLLPELLARRVLDTHWRRAPVAWGAAERQGTGNAAESYALMYKRLGLQMLPSHATLPGGGTALDPAYDLIQSAMSTGKFKLALDFYDLWDEISGLERDENGKIISIRNDILDAVRYAYLSRKQSRAVDCSAADPYDAEPMRSKMCQGVNFDVFDTSRDATYG